MGNSRKQKHETVLLRESVSIVLRHSLSHPFALIVNGTCTSCQKQLAMRRKIACNSTHFERNAILYFETHRSHSQQTIKRTKGSSVDVDELLEKLFCHSFLILETHPRSFMPVGTFRFNFPQTIVTNCAKLQWRMDWNLTKLISKLNLLTTTNLRIWWILLSIYLELIQCVWQWQCKLMIWLTDIHRVMYYVVQCS